ncbi:hypothetical protein [Propionivibrio sp.]|uniref:hypothetical protein n=1 Tax=Propionivibrio sp. TaxID=2212460 RepID=UPI0039E661D9
MKPEAACGPERSEDRTGEDFRKKTRITVFFRPLNSACPVVFVGVLGRCNRLGRFTAKEGAKASRFPQTTRAARPDSMPRSGVLPSAVEQAERVGASGQKGGEAGRVATEPLAARVPEGMRYDFVFLPPNMKTFLAVLFGLFSSAALSQSAIYHCVKNGKKIFSDQRCEEQGANETKRVNAQDMPPVNTTQVLTNDQRQQGQYLKDRLNSADRQFQDQRERDRREAAKVKRDNEKTCKLLWEEKKQIIDWQRTRNSDELNRRHREVNDEIYRLKCGS